jgi:Tfp pilus assembly PilM family ATPase
VVIRALRDSLTLTWDEARRLATDYLAGPHGDANDDQVASLVAEVVMTAINQLVAELERTLVYLKTHRSKLVPEQMWLFGGGAAVRGIAGLLQQRVNLEVACWSLGDASFRSNSAGDSPVAMLGPAIALSALAWEEL